MQLKLQTSIELRKDTEAQVSPDKLREITQGLRDEELYEKLYLLRGRQLSKNGKLSNSTEQFQITEGSEQVQKGLQGCTDKT